MIQDTNYVFFFFFLEQICFLTWIAKNTTVALKCTECFIKKMALTLMVRLDTAYFTENWKHCSKIIFKCVNSAMRPIFNESFVEKRGLWVLWIVYGTYWKNTLLAEMRFSNKKKKERKTQTLGHGCVSKRILRMVNQRAWFLVSSLAYFPQ